MFQDCFVVDGLEQVVFCFRLFRQHVADYGGVDPRGAEKLLLLWLRFRGGKGLASLGGVVLSCSWKAFLILLAIAFLIALVTNYVCFAAPVMSLVFPGWFYLRTGFLAAFLVLLIPAVPIILKHVENFRRIREGTEARFSYLWNKEAELERLGRS